MTQITHYHNSLDLKLINLVRKQVINESVRSYLKDPDCDQFHFQDELLKQLKAQLALCLGLLKDEQK